MRKVFIALIAVFICTGASAQGIKFEHGKLKDALTKAKDQNKIVFVDFHTKWCGPCKHMASTTFKDPKVGAFFNKNFISIKIDAEDTNVNGPKLADKYQVSGYPTLVFLKANGDVINKFSGAVDDATLINAGKMALGGDAGKNFKKAYAKYKNGDRSDDLLLEIINEAANSFTLNINVGIAKDELLKLHAEVIKIYFNNGSPEKFKKEKHFKVLSLYAAHQNILRGNKIIDYMISNYDEFKESIGERAFMMFLIGINQRSIKAAAKNKDKKTYLKYAEDRELLDKIYNGNEASIQFMMENQRKAGDQEYALAEKNYGEYLRLYKESINPNYASAITYLLPGRLIINANDGKEDIKEYLKQCLPFLETAHKNHNNAYVCCDYGKVLALIGEKKKAKEYYNEAMEIFKTLGSKGEKDIKRFNKEMAELGL